MYITQDATSALEALLILMSDPKAVKKQLEDLKAESKSIEENRSKLHKYEKDITALGKQIEDHKKELETKLQESLNLYASQLKAKEVALNADLEKASKLKSEYEEKLAHLKKLMNG